MLIELRKVYHSSGRKGHRAVIKEQYHFFNIQRPAPGKGAS